jgi:hypothetical protein
LQAIYFVCSGSMEVLKDSMVLAILGRFQLKSISEILGVWIKMRYEIGKKPDSECRKLTDEYMDSGLFFVWV